MSHAMKQYRRQERQMRMTGHHYFSKSVKDAISNAKARTNKTRTHAAEHDLEDSSGLEVYTRSFVSTILG